MFANLLNNAAKYTDPGGRITLGAECVALGAAPLVDGAANGAVRAEFVEVRVRDTGMGIAPEMLASVFDLFIQANRALDRSQGGLGVGLTIVQRLVEMHGGRVVARSEGHNRGSDFIVRLPLLLPGLVSGWLFAAILSFNEFTASLFVTGQRTQTLPVAMYNYVREYADPSMAALSVIYIAGIGILLTLANVFLGLGKVLNIERDH